MNDDFWLNYKDETADTTAEKPTTETADKPATETADKPATETADTTAEQTITEPLAETHPTETEGDRIFASILEPVSEPVEAPASEPAIITLMENRPRHKKRGGLSFRQVAAIVCLGALLGGGTLGGGVGLGYALGKGAAERRAINEAKNDFTNTQTPFSFTEGETIILPVNVNEGNYSDVIKTVSDAVVSISITATSTGMFGRGQESEGAGSGFIFAIDDERVYIATNNHVIESTSSYSISSVRVSLNDDKSVEAMFVGNDSQSDLAVIAVSKADLDALGVPYKAAVLGDSDAVQVGDEVVAIGNAMGEGQTATQGIISAVNRNITYEGITIAMIQTDAAINPGNSGGPLVNMNGEVIGVNTAKASAYGVEGMGYSIPSNEVKFIIESLRESGSVKKPYIGILNPTDIDERYKEMYSLPAVGVLVRGVEEGSGAEQGGIEPNDIIVGFNGAVVTSVETLRDALSETKVGDEVVVELYRGNTLLSLTIVIGDDNAVSNF